MTNQHKQRKSAFGSVCCGCENFFCPSSIRYGVLMRRRFRNAERSQSLTQSSLRVLRALCVKFLSDLCVSKRIDEKNLSLQRL